MYGTGQTKGELKMALKMTLWAFGLLFIATIWNVVTAYNAMGDVNVQTQFYKIGILESGEKIAEFPLPAHKPLMIQEVASSQ